MSLLALLGSGAWKLTIDAKGRNEKKARRRRRRYGNCEQSFAGADG